MSSYSIFFVLLIFFSTTASSCDNLVMKTCEEASNHNQNINYDFCVNALQSFPTTNSCADDLKCLGLISLTLAKENVTDTTSLIQSLLQNNMVDSSTKAGLVDCSDLYSDSSLTIDDATQDYMAHRLDDANIKVSSVMTSAITCEEGFQDLRVVSPLTKQNDYAFHLCALALYIMKSID